MKKIVIIVIILFLVSCNDHKVWDAIKNKEFSNYDVDTGSGFYFFEKDSKKYCTFMNYGSGLPVTYSYTSEVKFEGENITIELPLNKEAKNETIEVVIKYEEGYIIIFGNKYENMGIKNHEWIEDLKE